MLGRRYHRSAPTTFPLGSEDIGTGRQDILVLEQGVGYGSFTLGVPSSNLMPLVASVLASHSSGHSTEGRSSRGKVYRVGLYWESFIKISLEQSRAYDEASGGTFVNAHHYQHTEVGYNSCHEVDVKVPIGSRCSLSVSDRVSNRGYEEVWEAFLPRLANRFSDSARLEGRGQH